MVDWQVITGDCLEVMRGMDANSVDTIITDPPAGISMMGKSWDSDRGGRAQWVAWLTEVMAEGLRVLKPGGMALVWALPRTSHWTALAVEDAGFEIREKIYHLFGSGFPKSHDISKAIDRAAGSEREVVGDYQYASRKGGKVVSTYSGDWADRTELKDTAPATPAAQEWDGWGTALKPAAEEWIVAMKPLSSTFAANALEWGVAGLWIDGARVPVTDSDQKGEGGRINGTSPKTGKIPYEGGFKATIGQNGSVGRWPSNLIHDGSDEVLAGFPVTTSGGGNKSRNGTTAHTAVYGTYGPPPPDIRDIDTGSAARYFYCAKASRAERNAGLEGLEARRKKVAVIQTKGVKNDGEWEDGKQLSSAMPNHHPTVKPLALMRYLARLTKTPTGGVVLDPFAGSGSTGCAAVMEGRRFIGIELSDEYADIARKRIAHAAEQARQLELL